MPWKPPTPIEVYQLLPKTNCGKCGEPNCMAFAVKLVNFDATVEQCPPLVEDKSYAESLQKLRALLSPPVREVVVKSSKRVVKIGGEYVMYRHELRYMNPAAIAIDVDDSMDKDTILKRVETIEKFEYEYVGRKLKLDLIAVRSVTNDPKQFAKTVQIVAENSSLPLILCSTNPTVIEAGFNVLPQEHRPLIYAATKDNWRDMAELSKRFDAPLAIASPGDLDTLVSLVATLSEGLGLNDLVLDPGTFVGLNGLAYTVKAFTWLRHKAANDLWKYAGYPLIGTPISVWTQLEGDVMDKMWWEAIMATLLMTRYADVLIMHSLDGWVLLPQVMWRFQLYTDPRKPVAVPAGVREIGKPDEKSPVLVTTNYALTYSIVLSDVEKAKVNAWLVVVDTEGLAVDVAVAGRKFTGEKVAEVIKAAELDKKVKYKVLIIPGKAARVSGDVEDATGWKVVVGPMDSSEIGKFIEKMWTEDKLKELIGQ
ncbi:acetyl-CoA decarbonylase/synthase complex subunit gamma [Ignisphaera sp. 4213-co]|uniref:Acetyl-CoA decarbonylase/synthase complex subunit gamma n=1 Tax=Ignisphaera cupida TaxID=3050454 RepID=A0ABD4Z759_9CREN|nr:acetyl-CoA decarbonylase/synthase complex subunit gamma [Ignisphaera sp. 4213-co]MDK6028772.1 acetyl-CoA decarbonylase/synthase complex subunit gamma [Ignisphaera sp. 4213-co]